jgi:hypothetical protein
MTSSDNEPTGNELQEMRFLVTIDSMIESTLEFIRDDQITRDNDPEWRYKDLACLEHVRQLFIDFYYED